eukprot:1890251-Pleurochrysis_carterae.AAC.1
MRASERLCARVSVSVITRIDGRDRVREGAREGTRARAPVLGVNALRAVRVHVSTLVDWRANGRESTARADGGSLIGRTRARESAPGRASKRAPACAIA